MGLSSSFRHRSETQTVSQISSDLCTVYTAFIIELTGPYSGTRDTGGLEPSNIQFLTQSRTASPKFHI